MSKKFLLVFFSLMISLFIYLFYRTEKTVINELFIFLISLKNYVELRKIINAILPLNEYVVYSLPEGLWVLCITITSKNLFLKVFNFKLHLIFFPLIFSIGLEILQYFHLTNGRFDVLDITFSVVFWLTGNYLITATYSLQNIFNPLNYRSLMCILSYLIVYFAHVWK